MKLILISFIVLSLIYLTKSLHLVNRTLSSNNESETFHFHNQSIKKRQTEKIKNEIWFKFTPDELIDRDIIFNYPLNLRPIRKEYIYFERGFLLRVKWIESKNRYFNEDEPNKSEKYYFKNEKDKELITFDKRNEYQVFFYDIVMGDPNIRFINTIMQNKDNKNGSKKVEAYQFFDPIKLQARSNFNSLFNARVYDNDERESSFYVVGDFEEFSLLNYNEFPKEIKKEKIYISRLLLDYHYQRENESEILHYSEITKDRLKDLKNKKIFCYLDYYNYTLHIGRFSRFPENAWLMFLKIRDDKTGNYYTPYRVIAPNNYQQNEQYFYEIHKNKIKDYFNLQPRDYDYLTLFHKIENERDDSETVWMSDILLEYLKFLNPKNGDLVNYQQSNSKKLTYMEMVKKMCEFNKDKLTRLITLHITQDYNFLVHKKPMYQLSFSGKLILRWTCYSLNEKGCLDKTYSIVCRYLRKNAPAENLKTEITEVWPLPWIRKVDKPEPTVPPFVPRPTKFTSNDTITDNFFKDNYPIVKFEYSSADRPSFNLKFIIISLLLSFSSSVMLKYFY